MSQMKDRKEAVYLPNVEEIQNELGRAEPIDDFFGKDGIFSKLFARTIEEMLEAELTAHLGYEKHEARGRNSGNSRNGKRRRGLQTSAGDQTIQVPRDRNEELESRLLDTQRSNELERKITALYARDTTTHDIQETLADIYGVEIGAATVSAITDKIWHLFEEWQSRPLAAIYPIVYLDGLHLNLRREGKIEYTEGIREMKRPCQTVESLVSTLCNVYPVAIYYGGCDGDQHLAKPLLGDVRAETSADQHFCALTP
ncbi:MAG: transposase [Caldilineaceae bacterium]|nr:transposase [Caldilineaceae bacterium]